MRFIIKHAMFNHMTVKTTDNEAYNFELRKLESKTRILGVQYNKFLEDYNMQPSDIIDLHWQFQKPYLLLHPRDKDGIPKQRIVQSIVDLLCYRFLIIVFYLICSLLTYLCL